MSQLYVRLPDDVHSKLRVIAALKNESLNTTMVTISTRFIDDWEQKHGELPKPPEEE
jgi:plasmid stability protein